MEHEPFLMAICLSFLNGTRFGMVDGFGEGSSMASTISLFVEDGSRAGISIAVNNVDIPKVVPELGSNQGRKRSSLAC